MIANSRNKLHYNAPPVRASAPGPGPQRAAPLVYECYTDEQMDAARAVPIPDGWRDAWGPAVIIISIKPGSP